MKTRNTLTGAEVGELYETLNVRLSGIGLETQPAVATRILELTRDPETGMSDYAKIIRSDAALCGRLLRLANSAFFAQRQPVASVDRACVLLGGERLRSIALGFYLADAAATDPRGRVSREIWGQSVYRACLAAELARANCPALASEAFVIGLMLDAGTPLAYRLLGDAYAMLLDERLPPLKAFAEEFEHLPYTHVDVIAVLLRRWKFPDLLAKPIAWHHTPPAPMGGDEPVRQLHKIAYYVGAVTLRPEGRPAHNLPMPTTAQVHLDIENGRLREIIGRSSAEYSSVLEIFDGVAEGVGDTAALASAVQRELIEVLDETMAGTLQDMTAPKPQKFTLGGLQVVIRPDDKGMGTAYAYDSRGEPLSAYRFVFNAESPESIRHALGLEADERDELEPINQYIEYLAA